MIEKLKSKLSKDVYKNLEAFVINETNFSTKQKEKFTQLVEKIYSDKTVVVQTETERLN